MSIRRPLLPRLAAAFAALLAGAILASCGAAPAAAPTSAAATSIPATSVPATSAPAASEATAAPHSRPTPAPSAPPEIPIPGDAGELSRGRLETPQGVEQQIRFITPLPAEETLRWYGEELRALGWVPQTEGDQREYVLREGCPNYGLNIEAGGTPIEVVIMVRPLLCE